MSANQKEKQKKLSMTGVEEVNIWQGALRAVLEEQSLKQQNLWLAWRTHRCEGRPEGFCLLLSNKWLGLSGQQEAAEVFSFKLGSNFNQGETIVKKESKPQG